MHKSDGIVLAVLLAGTLFSIGKKKLTGPAAVTGAVLGWIIYTGGGYTGLAMMTAFFILGTTATSWKKETPAEQTHIDQTPAEQPRTTGQVIANAGVAGITGLLSLLWPAHRPLLLVIMAGSLASAAADTLSSELGMIYGRRFFHILTGRTEQKGLDGVVSIEGLLIGTLAAGIIAVIYTLGQSWDWRIFVIITLSGTLGNLTDSILGAVFERKGQMSNDTVNFLNTLAAALTAGGLIEMFIPVFG
jgi:uncharacterized protein (TIGR00297 family)